MPQGFEIEQLVKGRYLITGRLDKDKSYNDNKSIGAFGEVYLALDTLEDNRPVVIKALKDEWINVEKAKKLFLKEAEALNRLTEEPRVVGLLSSKEQINGEVFFLEETGRPFFVLEFIKGKNLREILLGGKLDSKTAAHYVEQLATGLEAIHAKNIIHRDLKPENVMIVEKDNQPHEVKIIDFGTALVGYSAYFPSTIYTDTAQKPFVGTPAYASPEHLEGNETEAGEVFTLAAMAFEMLTGKIAFPINEVEKVKKLHEKEIDFPASLSSKTIEVLKKGLALKPVDRFQKPVEFADELKASFEKDPKVISTIEENHSTPDKSVITQNKTPFGKKILLVTALSGLLAAVLLGFSYLNPGNKNGLLNTNTAASPEVSQTPETLFRYSFEVQKMKNNLVDGKLFATAEKSQIRFGDKFNLKVEREKTGHFYIIEQNGENVKLIFPDGSGDAKIISAWRVSKPDQSFLLVWSKESIESFETMPLNEVKVRQFLQNNPNSLDAKENSGKMEVKGTGSLLIYKLLL